jgi:hypothetical protein
MGSTGQSVGAEVQAACQAVRTAASENNVAALTRLLGIDQRRTRSASTSAVAELEPMRHRAMLVAADESGKTAVMHAAGNGNVNVIRLLLDHPSADPAAMMMLTTSEGSTALMFAAWKGEATAMRLLLDHPSADPAAQMMAANSSGSTALMYASQNGNLEAMRSTTRLQTQPP